MRKATNDTITTSLGNVDNKPVLPLAVSCNNNTANDDTLSVASSSTSITSGTDACSTKTFENEPTFHSSLRFVYIFWDIIKSNVNSI